MGIDGSAVIDDPAIHGPCPGPFREHAEARRIVFPPPRHHIDDFAFLLRVALGVYPIAARCGPVCLQMDEGSTEVAFFAEELGRRDALVVDVLQIVAVDLLGYVLNIDFLDLSTRPFFPVVPGEVHDGRRELSTLFLIKVLYPEVELVHDFRVRFGLADRINGLVPPLCPPARVGDASFLFHGRCSGEQEDLGLDILRDSCPGLSRMSRSRCRRG